MDDLISIKEVTKQTGITVRTLRYYDQIGLLHPAGKTEGGHRLYGKKELAKLQEIQFLKTLGFSLQEIKNMLFDHQWDWVSCLQNQLTYIQKEKDKLEEIESTIKGLMNSLTMDGDINLIDMQKLIELYKRNMDQRMEFRNQLFNEDEKELLDLLPNVNSGDPDTLEWVSLLGQLKQHMSKGAQAPEVQRIIRRIHEKQKETFGDNDAFLKKLWEVRKSPEKSQKIGFYPIESDVLEFMEIASEIFLNRKQHD
ncbi:MAG TPA: MerR family transcriptional regulator [Virgibacillus sp.]|nr:MerR family transcriptional regulator [Virgibacillus sp.]HLR66726.1 MerR family transcriptional regulator [Virgibacillus sp.]